MTQSPGRDVDDSGNTSMKQGRVRLCNCQILACHVITSCPSPPALWVRGVSQLLNTPSCDCDRRSSAWAFTCHNVCAKLTSTSIGGVCGDKSSVASIGAMRESGSYADC